MHLKQLTLLNFKTYDQAEIELHPKINCFFGDNGEGKTNLLDSIFYLSMCKSNFNSIDYQNIKHNKEFFVIQGTYNRNDKLENIYCAVKKGAGKTFRRNGKDYRRLAEHIGHIPVVIIAPTDSSLILDGSEERRKYINGVISQYNNPYLESIIRYNKLIANRNRLLKSLSKGESYNSDLFEVIDEQLGDLAQPIYSQRLEFAQKLSPIFQHYYNTISKGAEKVELIYQSDLQENDLKSLLKESMPKDRMLQYTSKGIHRDDLILTLNNHPIKKEGSQGQQKTYLVALKLAQFSFVQKLSGLKPILLLDDIFDKLDMNRVEQFIRLVANDEFGQIFITDTNKARLDVILEKINTDYKLFTIKQGQIEETARK